jgi:hypothetical protein
MNAADGVYDNFGTVSPIMVKDDWFHFSMTFPNTKKYIIPYFELSNDNGIDSTSELIDGQIFLNIDSQVFLDNVSINPVPEPATLLLLGSGLITLIGMARKRRKN